MKVYRKIIAVFCSIAIITSCVVLPASAAGIYDNAATLWDWAGIMYKAWKTANPDAPDSEYPGFNPGGMFGNGFGASRGDYDNFVSDLPASGYTSTGGLILRSDIVYVSFSSVAGMEDVFNFGTSKTATNNRFSFNYDGAYTLTAIATSTTLDHTCKGFAEKCTFIAPVTGTYRLLSTPFAVISDGTKSFTFVSAQGTNFGKNAGDTYTISLSHQRASDYASDLLIDNPFEISGTATVIFEPLMFEVFPTSSVTNTYPDTSRPTSITGDYGIIGDNGEITKVDGDVLVDESRNVVYNPVKGIYYDMSSWSYDYSSRTYTITTTTDNSITVTYGDEYVTINEGDTIYNVYYIVEGGSTSAPGDCAHEYTSSVTTSPTCEAPGIETFTCSNCGNSYTKRIPAMGHTWTVKQTVPTEYDENGNLVTQGYTIYQCSVCGEEYKDSSGNGPPDAPPQDEEVTEEGFFGWLWGILKKLIGAVVNGIVSIFEFFFGGDGAPDEDFYNSPSTFSGVSVWA